MGLIYVIATHFVTLDMKAVLIAGIIRMTDKQIESYADLMAEARALNKAYQKADGEWKRKYDLGSRYVGSTAYNPREAVSPCPEPRPSTPELALSLDEYMAVMKDRDCPLYHYDIGNRDNPFHGWEPYSVLVSLDRNKK